MSFSSICSISLTFCLLSLCSCESNEIVEWFAPIFSGGGYCSEALAFAASIETVSNISFHYNVEHHGDTYRRTFVEGRPANLLIAEVSKVPNSIVI